MMHSNNLKLFLKFRTSMTPLIKKRGTAQDPILDGVELFAFEEMGVGVAIRTIIMCVTVV